MNKETISYQHDGITFKSYAAYKTDGQSPRPAVLVAHAWRGQDDFARKKAEALAELGYYGFAADVYGNGQTANTDEEAAKLMVPLFTNRALLRSRILAAYKIILQQSQADKERIGAIGFCFGGLTVLELSRSGANLRGAVSFHGVLGDKLGDNIAKLAPPAAKRHGAILILHGNKDPLVSQSDILSMQQELTNANIDWQMDIYGQAAHAFTNPEAQASESGMVYNAKADRRSWLAMKNFFKEVFA